jgi:chromate transporter
MRDPSRLYEVAQFFLRLGITGFGGPAAHIAMMHDEVVKRRQWIDEQHFLDLIGATNLIPGPNSTEMAIQLGFVRAGWLGLIVGGVCFIAPAMCIVMTLAWVYAQFGATVTATHILYGVKPVIIVIVAQALWDLGRKAVKGWLTGSVGATALALYFLGVNEIMLLVVSGLVVMVIANVRRMNSSSMASLFVPLISSTPVEQPSVGFSKSSILTAWCAVSKDARELASRMVRQAHHTCFQFSQLCFDERRLPMLMPFDLSLMFFTFLKIGSVLYGSGYVLLAFLRADFVTRLGWLTDQQLLDAIAIGQVTPGPVLTTATFIGYVLGGAPAALLATLGIFLPAFVFVALSNPLIPRIRNSAWAKNLLDGVNVASLALMAAVSIQLGMASLVDLLTVALALATWVLLFRYKINSTWLVLGGAIIGWLSGWFNV